MDKETLFQMWAPTHGIWSAWAKPVLFAHWSLWREPAVVPQPPVDLTWAPRLDSGTALVLDLPSAFGVHVAVSLARTRGYRPVPLYNACPPMEARMPAAVEVWPILDAMVAHARELDALQLSSDAPPAFLLDSNRRVGHRIANPGMFDNRSVSFPTDFPSGNLLLSRGISRVLLVQAKNLAPQADLAHTLSRWQRAGLTLEQVGLDAPEFTKRLILSRPSFLSWIAFQLSMHFSLRRSPLGGFGGVLPDAGSGS